MLIHQLKTFDQAKNIFYVFLLIHFVHTAGKEILVGTSVGIFNRNFLILYN